MRYRDVRSGTGDPNVYDFSAADGSPIYIDRTKGREAIFILNGADEVVEVGSRDFWLEHALEVIESTYGDTVSIQDKDKDLLKFGRSEQVDNTSGGTTIMTLPSGVRHELDLYANDIDKVTSSSSSDASKVLSVEGHTYSAGALTFVVQDVTLDASPDTTAATLSTPLRNVTRAYLKNSGTAGSPQSDLVGNIYFYDDNGGTITISSGVPSDTTYIHMMIRAGENQTEKASTAISNSDYWIVTGAYCDMLSKASAAIAEVDVEIRDVENGGAWRKLFDMPCSADGGGTFRSGYPYIIIPKNHDIRMVGLGDSATDRIVSGGIFGALAVVV